jgi:hypothetical protein
VILKDYQLKGEYRIVRELRELSGWGWDDVKKMVVASDSVWDAYLEVRRCCICGEVFTY